ncbi:hypothetical protein [Bathymodiolus platifrons methanotrophic gill symbiont]|nr:hypothetical protein [Bathymodiolus platifrons methanotrophic gill symbiont]
MKILKGIEQDYLQVLYGENKQDGSRWLDEAAIAEKNSFTPKFIV